MDHVLDAHETGAGVLCQQINHQMIGSAWEPRHATCTGDVWKHKGSMDHELAISCESQIKLDAQQPLDSTTVTDFTNCDQQQVSSGCVPRSAFWALTSALKPRREVSSVAAGMLRMVGKRAHPIGSIVALLILFAAHVQFCFFCKTGGVSPSSHKWQQVSTRKLRCPYHHNFATTI